jgi:hypothetical protein
MLSRREAVGLALALLVHAAALLCIERRAQAPALAPEAAPFEVELETPPAERPDEPVRPAEPVERHADEPRLTSVPPATAARAPAIDQAPRQTDETAGNAAPEPAPTPASSAFSLSPGGAPALSNEALGLSGRNRFLGAVPGQSGVTSLVDEGPTNVAPGVDRSIHDALAARDHDLGLDIAGPLVAIAEELTRPSDTPMNGRAVFEVILDADGYVRDVRVIDVSDSRGSWERLGAQLGATLRTRRIALRTKGHAMVARIEVTSRWALPSGHPAGRAPGEPFVKGSSESILAGMHFDVSDIGARPARDVHARILGESPL